jgi:hypothetical protein
MIRKAHHSVMPTRPSTGVLTSKKITIRRQLVVPSSSNNDYLPLVKHDAQVDLNLRACTHVRLTSVEPPYILSGQRIRVGCSKVLISNPEYKGKGRTESASSNPTLRLRRPPLPKIHGPPAMMQFSNDEGEEEELSN